MNKHPVYRFDEFLVDPDSWKLCRGGDEIHLEPVVLKLLIYLIANRDRLVTRQELMDTVWGDTVISEAALSKAVARLRKALGDDSAHPRYLETVHSQGFRFVAEVEEGERPERSERRAGGARARRGGPVAPRSRALPRLGSDRRRSAPDRHPGGADRPTRLTPPELPGIEGRHDQRMVDPAGAQHLGQPLGRQQLERPIRVGCGRMPITGEVLANGPHRFELTESGTLRLLGGVGFVVFGRVGLVRLGGRLFVGWGLVGRLVVGHDLRGRLVTGHVDTVVVVAALGASPLLAEEEPERPPAPPSWA